MRLSEKSALNKQSLQRVFTNDQLVDEGFDNRAHCTVHVSI